MDARADHIWLTLLRWLNRQTKNTRLLRHFGIAVYRRALMLAVRFPPPRVLANGAGKSGTHRLSDCLALMPQMVFSGFHFALSEYLAGRPEDYWNQIPTAPLPELQKNRLRKNLQACPRGTFITAHAPYHPELHAQLTDLEFRHILLLRDPRDVAVSYTWFVTREQWHPHHRYYRESLHTWEQRLLATIEGFEGGGGTPPLPPIDKRLKAYAAWLEQPDTLIVRFEDLVGPQGGGTREKQFREIDRIARFIERPLDRTQIGNIAQRVYSRKSLTYRKGRIGDWKTQFTDRHLATFNQLAGHLLHSLGYAGNDHG